METIDNETKQKSIGNGMPDPGIEGDAPHQRIEGEESEKHVCLSCGMEYEGNYCPNCGQSKKVGRLSLKRVLTESLPDIYNLDNRFLRTCIDLFRRPGEMIMEYIKGNRVIYYKPISLLFVLASILIIVKHLCNIETTHEFGVTSKSPCLNY